MNDLDEVQETKVITLRDIKKDPEIETYIHKGDEYLDRMGFTEHGLRHLNLVSHISSNVLIRLGYDHREVELVSIAGYLHDIGNVVSRYNHGSVGASMVFNMLTRKGMDAAEIAVIVSAIGNHEEEHGYPVNPVAAALILGDKSDVHRSRVRNRDVSTFDIHDRVNYAVERSFLNVDGEKRTVVLELEIDRGISTIMEYFEIFLVRMMMCRRATDLLKCEFGMVINGAKFL